MTVEDKRSCLPHYFLRDTTGHHRPTQFEVYFDGREIKFLNFRGVRGVKEGSEETSQEESPDIAQET